MKRWKPTAADYEAARTDTGIRNAIVEANLGLVGTIAHQHLRPGVDIEDLVQAGVLGLMRALRTFDPARAQLSTYAGPWIRCYVSNVVRRATPPVSGICRKGPKEVEREYAKTGNERCRLQLAAFGRASSLDAPVTGNSTGSMALETLGDHMPGPDDVHAEAEANESAATINTALASLQPRERYIVKRRMRDATLQEIGTEQGCSRERIRQIDARAMGKIKEAIGGRA